MTTCNPDLPEPVAAEMKAAEAAITSGKLKPFAGEIKDQKGTVKVTKGQELADADIKGMTWLIEGVQGTLPQN
ncbi:hypothetical protein IB244_01270 [Rhizobium sp. RHZ02]|uniref:hypothetical protein n=1 Tax=Rhizobium sp. RHZ02 TaxID=2769306 RepID=UPI0017869709|nr:hypothetical protein [Rhizobium sp. RHZ02]MBD9450215.1 hypothetical protein [Rhizobium sp. RHZ02]